MVLLVNAHGFDLLVRVQHVMCGLDAHYNAWHLSKA